jgi:RNase P protein component
MTIGIVLSLLLIVDVFSASPSHLTNVSSLYCRARQWENLQCTAIGLSVDKMGLQASRITIRRILRSWFQRNKSQFRHCVP